MVTPGRALHRTIVLVISVAVSVMASVVPPVVATSQYLKQIVKTHLNITSCFILIIPYV
jgi:hypothetical protein